MLSEPIMWYQIVNVSESGNGVEQPVVQPIVRESVSKMLKEDRYLINHNIVCLTAPDTAGLLNIISF